MITVQENQMGVVTFWTLGLTSHSQLESALTAAGLEAFMPSPMTPLNALYSALREQYPECLIRQLDKPGFAVVEEKRGADDNQYRTLCTAKLDKESLDLTVPYNESVAIRGAYGRFRQQVPVASVAKMLSEIAAELLSSTMLRPTGGIYWFSARGMEIWQKVATAVENCGKSNRVYVIRHNMDPDAIKAVRDSLVAEITAETARLNAEILSGELGERALGTRETEARELISKVKEYETILGVGLEALRENLAQVETAAATAILVGAGTAQQGA